MDQARIGAFLKKLRNEKHMTQEQLAEQFYVSSRTVSRWETGSNMPDLSVLIELADFYDVDIREIINGERKSENMNAETKETLMAAAEYSSAEKNKLKKKILENSLTVAILMAFWVVLEMTNGFGVIAERPIRNIQEFVMALSLATLGINALYLCGVFEKIDQWKARRNRREKP